MQDERKRLTLLADHGCRSKLLDQAMLKSNIPMKVIGALIGDPMEEEISTTFRPNCER